MAGSINGPNMLESEDMLQVTLSTPVQLGFAFKNRVGEKSRGCTHLKVAPRVAKVQELTHK